MTVFGALQAALEPYQFQTCFLIFVFVVANYVIAKLSMATTSMMGMFLLILTGLLEPKEALTYIGNNTVVMCAGMMMVAAGFQRTSFCTVLANKVADMAKGNIKLIMFSYALLAMILSQFIQAPLVAFGICAPLLISSVEVLGVNRSKVIFPLGIVAICTCCALPFGAGATVATELNGYMESYGYIAYQVGLTDPALARFPILLISIIYVTFIAMKLAPEQCLTPSTFEKVDAKKAAALKPYQEKAGVVIFFGTSAALMFGDKLGLATWVITCLGGLLIVLFGILKKKEAVDAMGISMALVIAGSLSLAGALSSTGAGEMIGGFVSNFAHSVGGNSYIVGFIFFIFPFALTQFMLNRATMLIFHPIAIATAASLGADPRGLMILVQAACLTAFMTPMANGTVPFIMGYGGYTQKSLLKQGLPIAIVICLVSVLWTMTVFPLFP